MADNVLIRIDVDGKSIAVLREDLKALRQRFQEAKPDTPEWAALGNAMKQVDTRLRDLTQQFRGVSGVVKESRQEARLWRFALLEAVHAFDGIANAMAGVTGATGKSLENIKKFTSGLTDALGVGLSVTFALKLFGETGAKIAGPAGIIAGVAIEIANLVNLFSGLEEKVRKTKETFEIWKAGLSTLNISAIRGQVETATMQLGILEGRGGNSSADRVANLLARIGFGSKAEAENALKDKLTSLNIALMEQEHKIAETLNKSDITFRLNLEKEKNNAILSERMKALANLAAEEQAEKERIDREFIGQDSVIKDQKLKAEQLFREKRATVNREADRKEKIAILDLSTKIEEIEARSLSKRQQIEIDFAARGNRIALTGLLTGQPTSITSLLLQINNLEKAAALLPLKLENVKNLLSPIQSGFAQLGQMIQKGLVDALGEATSLFQGFVQGVLAGIAQIAEKLAASAIVSGIMSLFGPVGTFASAFASLSGFNFASGGMIGEPVLGMGMKSGKSYTFAERGPEYVSPAGQASQMGMNRQQTMQPVFIVRNEITAGKFATFIESGDRINKRVRT